MIGFDDDFYEDPFESILNDFFGSRVKRKHKNAIIKGEEEERNIDFIEGEEYIYLIFEFPGYNEKDVDIKIKNDILEIKVKKNEDSCISDNVKNYLIQKLCQGLIVRKHLPEFINSRNFSYSMKNGVLEIIFIKNDK